MNFSLKPLSVALAAGLLLAASAARAQQSVELIMENYTSSVMSITSTQIGNIMVEEAVRRNNGLSPRAGKTAPAAAAKTPAASFAYTPTPALRQQTVQGYVNRLKANNPAAAQAVAANLGPGKHDYGQVYRGIVQGTGLRENDAADNLAAYLVLGWMIVNDVRQASGLPAGAPRGVRAQLAPKLAANAQLTKPGTAAQLGEELKLLLVVVQGGWQAALKENTLPQYRQGVAAMFKNQYGLNMAQLKLTPQGFAKK